MSLLPDKLHSQWERWNRNAPYIRERAATLRDGRPRVGYIGWQGHQNLGDDAMFEAAHRLLPGWRVVPVVPHFDEHFLNHFRLSGPRYFDAVILGGGTLINPDWIPWVAPFLERGVPAYALGTGVGSAGFEQPDDIGVSVWKPYLEQFKAIGVRGPRSLATLQAMGIQNAEIVGDLALELAAPGVTPSAEPPQILLNLSLSHGGIYGEGEYAIYKDVEQILRDALQKGWDVRPVAMFPSDVAPLKTCLAKIGAAQIPVAQPTTAAEFFKIARPCRFAVAVRLHAAILSCCAGVPPLMLGYRDKCLDFMETLTLVRWYVGLGTSDAGEVIVRASELSDAAPFLKTEILMSANRWQESLRNYARQHFTI